MPVKKIKSDKKEAISDKLKVKRVSKVSSKVAIKKEATVPTSSRLAGLRGASKTAKAGLTADVFDTKGKVVKKMDLPKDIFGAKINTQLMTQAVRVYLANQRRGTVSTKTRGEVKGSSKKIYRQKGTGRARHGSLRAPIFVHGGIAFGPHPRDYSLKLTKKMKKVALFSALSEVYKKGNIKIVSDFDSIAPKTKAMVEVLKNLSVASNNKKLLLVLPSKLESVERAARNIPGITMMMATQLNTYEVLKNNSLLFMSKSIDVLESHFGKNK